MCVTKKLKRSLRQSRGSNSGFTLVELLLVIAIISVLSLMSLGVLRNAQDNAKSAATQARITQIESLFAILLEDYEVRRLPISNRDLAAYVRGNPAQDENGDSMKVFVQVQLLRRQILMDIISSEIPRAFINDAGELVLNPDLGKFPSNERPIVDGSPSEFGFDGWLRENYPNAPLGGSPSLDPLLAQELANREPAGVRSLERLASASSEPDNVFDLPGEYLYAVLQRMDIDGTPAVETIGNAAIGNTDGDSFPELIDAWDDPLQLRIWQVNAVPAASNPGSYLGTGSAVIFQDIPGEDIDFDQVDADGVPMGYVGLNPQVPREIQQIRFQIFSPRLGARN